MSDCTPDFLDIQRGDSPLILAMPHTGTELPAVIADALNDRGLMLADTDWHIDRLYSRLIDRVTCVRTRLHRYVIDVNRAPDDESLYPGQNTTGLCPLTDFDGQSIYKPGREPTAAETAARLAHWHQPYHAALRQEIERLQARHGQVVLYDCHSIRSELPYLFDGQLPLFNIGTDDDRSCDSGIARLLRARCEALEHASWVFNGRFKGGWTTRHYGRPDQGVQAVQMEIAQRGYMQESPPWLWHDLKAQQMRAFLRDLLHDLADWRAQ